MRSYYLFSDPDSGLPKVTHSPLRYGHDPIGLRLLRLKGIWQPLHNAPTGVANVPYLYPRQTGVGF